jgi:ribosome biogenesis SPOUT family RNA methylase Rps3
VDSDHALEEAIVYKGTEERLQNLPERVTLRCQVSKCKGRIVITRPMLEEMLGADHA